jgi:hypothetical protein
VPNFESPPGRPVELVDPSGEGCGGPLAPLLWKRGFPAPQLPSPGFMTRHYRSPTSVPIAVAAAPARLAEEYGGCAYWREMGDAVIEVATMRGSEVQVHRVLADGRTMLVDRWPASAADRWGGRIKAAGVALSAAGFVAAFVVYSHGTSGSGAPFMWPLLAGLALVAIGASARGRQRDLGVRVQKRGGDSWQEATPLEGWTPHSSEQLATVEQLADEHGGLAYVREVESAMVDVLVERGRHIDRYWVDARGQSGLGEQGPPKSPFVLPVPALALIVAGILALLSVNDLNRWTIVPIALVLLGVARRPAALSSRARHLARADGRSWTRIQTQIDDPD